MPTEDLQAYQRHLESFTAECNPKGPIEAHLVQALADTSWRLNRVAALETNLLSLGVASGSGPLIGAPQQIQDALAIAAALESQSKALSNLSMHSRRLSRQFERTLVQPRELQQTRRGHEKWELDNLLDIIEMYESKGEPLAINHLTTPRVQSILETCRNQRHFRKQRSFSTIRRTVANI
jgi:hypothetical protein